MALVSVTLVMESLAIGGGRFKWLAGRTTVSSVVAMVKLRGAVDLVDIWNGVSVFIFFQEPILFLWIALFFPHLPDFDFFSLRVSWYYSLLDWLRYRWQ